MLTLGAWGNAWIEYQLDPKTGQWHVRHLPVANSTESPVGFASVEPLWGVWRRFYAFYAHEGRLYFFTSAATRDRFRTDPARFAVNLKIQFFREQAQDEVSMR